jgi:hypothetical protein
VGRGAEAGGDAVAVGAVHHAVHDPVAAGLDAAARGLVELHPSLAGGSHGGDLGDRQAGALDLHQRPAVLLHHTLHGFQVAPGEVLRRLAPVQRVGTRHIHAEAVAGVSVLALHWNVQAMMRLWEMWLRLERGSGDRRLEETWSEEEEEEELGCGRRK